MLVKVDKLIGPALDWAVAYIENPEWSDEDCTLWVQDTEYAYNPSTDWKIGGPIVDNNPRISPTYDERFDSWFAYKQSPVLCGKQSFLVSAMRAYVANKLGDEVEVPDELFKGNYAS